jgi:hypothetical protein
MVDEPVPAFCTGEQHVQLVGSVDGTDGVFSDCEPGDERMGPAGAIAGIVAGN